MTDTKCFEGGCLCGGVRYRASAEPVFPHLCSCTMCQRWSGAPTVAWVEFPLNAFEWTGRLGEPNYFRSSEKTQRGSCPECGGSLCAIDDGNDNICLVIASLDQPDLITPDVQHSFSTDKPRWWHVDLIKEKNSVS